ncbi:MAG: hypothetical protein ACOCR6_01830 [archaeon]
MARGFAAFVVVASLILSMTMLSGVGYYSQMGANLDVESQNDDVQAAADQLDGVEFGEGRAASILEGPLAAVMPVIDMVMAVYTVIKNTSGVLQLLYGLPPAVADPLELVFRIAMLATMAYLIRSGSPV